MMMRLAGYPFWSMYINDQGYVMGLWEDEFAKELEADGVTDLFIFSHGWNNTPEMALELYRDFFSEMAKLRTKPGAVIGVLGVVWPSILYPGDGRIDDGELTGVFQRVVGHPHLSTAVELLERRPADHAALLLFRDAIRALLEAESEGREESVHDDLTPRIAGAGDAEWLEILRAMSSSGDVEAGGAAGLGDAFGALWSGATNVLRVASFYQMKKRAGQMGEWGLGPFIGNMQQALPKLRVHLVGHSFGARLVSHALAGLPEECVGKASPVKSLLLLQGAFSHFAFADALPFDRTRHGDLCGMAARVDGPLAATFSHKDTAVGMAYPAASIVARQDASEAGDLRYRWEGMGYDGAQTVGAVTAELGAPGTVYPWRAGQWVNLDGNDVIRKGGPPAGAHGDVVHPETAWAALSAAGIAA